MYNILSMITNATSVVHDDRIVFKIAQYFGDIWHSSLLSYTRVQGLESTNRRRQAYVKLLKKPKGALRMKCFGWTGLDDAIVQWTRVVAFMNKLRRMGMGYYLIPPCQVDCVWFGKIVDGNFQKGVLQTRISMKGKAMNEKC